MKDILDGSQWDGWHEIGQGCTFAEDRAGQPLCAQCKHSRSQYHNGVGTDNFYLLCTPCFIAKTMSNP